MLNCCPCLCKSRLSRGGQLSKLLLQVLDTLVEVLPRGEKSSQSISLFGLGLQRGNIFKTLPRGFHCLGSLAKVLRCQRSRTLGLKPQLAHLLTELILPPSQLRRCHLCRVRHFIDRVPLQLLLVGNNLIEIAADFLEELKSFLCFFRLSDLLPQLIFRLNERIERCLLSQGIILTNGQRLLRLLHLSGSLSKCLGNLRSRRLGSDRGSLSVLYQISLCRGLRPLQLLNLSGPQSLPAFFLNRELSLLEFHHFCEQGL